MKQLIVGNWKMNLTRDESSLLVNELLKNNFQNNVEVVLCPPFISIQLVGELIKNSSIKIGAQNISEHESGAYTGEISSQMLKSYNCNYCIVGHSERRQYFNETDELVNKKSKILLSKNIKPIICVGETLSQREENKTAEIITVQIKGALKNFSETEILNSVIAYEPVWAIGTGKTASTEQANEVHELIRTLLAQLYNREVAIQIPILYGGSVKGENALELLSQNHIDGALVGGAALKSSDFAKIIVSAKNS